MLPNLLACPTCERQVSPAASACPGCGHPLREAPRHVAAPQLFAAPAPSPFACPRCRSEQVTRFPVLWQDGMNALQLTTASLSQGGGAGVAFTGGTSQTVSSAAAAPPRLLYGGGAAKWAFVGGPLLFLVTWAVFGGTWYAGVFALAVGGLVSTLNYRKWQAIRAWNRDEFPRVYHQWENTYRCGRCGEVYVTA